jgi:hypothetical protein
VITVSLGTQNPQYNQGEKIFVTLSVIPMAIILLVVALLNTVANPTLLKLLNCVGVKAKATAVADNSHFDSLQPLDSPSPGEAAKVSAAIELVETNSRAFTNSTPNLNSVDI